MRSGILVETRHTVRGGAFMAFWTPVASFKNARLIRFVGCWQNAVLVMVWLGDAADI
jgi:hypothetical protein